jgi:NADH-quinone oxidoreductase subunit E
VSFFDDANLQRAKEILGRYPRARSAILPLAHLAQDQDGWLSPDAIEQIAELTGCTAADVLGTCSFYTMFKRKPVGKLIVSVCTNVSCLVNGGNGLLEHLEHRYADDDDVLVEEVECIAACDLAPVLQVNYEFHGPLTNDAADQLIDDYKGGARVARTISGTPLVRSGTQPVVRSGTQPGVRSGTQPGVNS